MNADKKIDFGSIAFQPLSDGIYYFSFSLYLRPSVFICG
jgi:hypothetical protein